MEGGIKSGNQHLIEEGTTEGLFDTISNSSVDLSRSNRQTISGSTRRSLDPRSSGAPRVTL